MGKKVKKKARSGQKEKKGSSVSSKTAVQQEESEVETPVNDFVDIKERGGLCSHIDRGINLDKLSAKFGYSQSVPCEDCRENVDGRVKKGKGKQGKKGGIKSKSEFKAIWVCLECGRASCGGVGLPTTPQSHAGRHAKLNHHPLVVNYENHQLLWCFSCGKLIPAEKSEDGKYKDALNDIDKILKGRSSKAPTVDVEDVWFGSGSVTSAVNSDYSSNIGADGRAGYSVRGLVNLGNTCFLNSVMQNLLAINSLRDYYFKLDDSIGCLSAAIRKLFLETCSETSSRSAINPRPLFGSLCIKAPQFRGYQQHDSHELLRCLLDGLSTEEISARKHVKSNEASITDPTFVDAIFGGRLSSIVSCSECGHSSTVYEPFLDLSLPVPTKKPPVRTQPATRSKKPKAPPKKSGRNLSKISKGASTVRGDGASAQSTSENSPGEMPIAIPTNQPVQSSSESSFPDSIDPNTIARDMGFTTEDLSAIQKPENQQTGQNVEEQSITSDSVAFSWLDYLDTEPVSHDIDVATEMDEVLVHHGFANEGSLQTGASLSVNLDTTECNLANAVSESSSNNTENDKNSFEKEQDVKPQSAQALSSECTFSVEIQCNADFGHCSDSCQQDGYRDSNASGGESEHPSQIQDVKLQFNEAFSSEYEKVVQCDADIGQHSDLCKQVCSGDSNSSGRDNECPQIHDSEDRLLPDKEYVLSGGEVSGTKTEVSSIVLGAGQGRDNEHISQNRVSEVQLLTGKGNSSGGEALGTDCEVSSVVLGDEQDSLGFVGFGDLFNEPEVSSGHPVSEGNDASKSGVTGNSSESDPDEIDNADAPVSVESCLALYIKPEFLSKDEHAWQCDNCTKVLQEKRNRFRKKAQNTVQKIVPNGYRDGDPCGSVDVGNTCNEVKSVNGNNEGEAADSSESSSLAKGRESYDNGNCIAGKQPEESNLDSVKRKSEGSKQKEAISENLKVKRDATKSMLINKPPSILTIHLKRFSQDARGRLSKLNGHVKFRETIDLKPYMDNRCTENEKLTYCLTGVVEHLGTMRGGHYVAYVRDTKNAGDGTWYHASDTYVREASLEEVLRCEAYILFYQRT